MVFIEEELPDSSPPPSPPRRSSLGDSGDTDSYDSAEEDWVAVDHGDAASPRHPIPAAQQQAQPAEVVEEEGPAVVQEKLARADAIKAEGNQLFAAGQLQEALEKYSDALEQAPSSATAAPQRAIYLCNRAACRIRLAQPTEAAADCSAAIEADPRYTKAYLRRCAAYEELDDVEKALTDAQKALELEPGSAAAAEAAARLEPIVAERREKMKEEMIGKLKELGNTVLGKFGMSLDNFKAEQDPVTGGYSLKFQ